MSHKMGWFLGVAALAILVGMTTANGAGDDGAAKAKTAEAKVIVPFFGNEKCPMSGNDVNPNAYVKVDNERVYFCCRQCSTKGKEDPKAWYKKAYAEPVKLKLEKCPMSGQPVKEEKAQVVKYQGYEVTLCCGGCVKKFPGKAYSTLVRAKYPKAKWVGNKTCPLMEDEDVDSELMAIYENRLVHFCCEMCIDDFIDDPKAVMAMLKDG